MKDRDSEVIFEKYQMQREGWGDTKKTFAENPQIAPIIGVAAAGAAPAKPVMTGTPAAAAAAPAPA